MYTCIYTHVYTYNVFYSWSVIWRVFMDFFLWSFHISNTVVMHFLEHKVTCAGCALCNARRCHSHRWSCAIIHIDYNGILGIAQHASNTYSCWLNFKLNVSSSDQLVFWLGYYFFLTGSIVLFVNNLFHLLFLVFLNLWRTSLHYTFLPSISLH